MLSKLKQLAAEYEIAQFIKNVRILNGVSQILISIPLVSKDDNSKKKREKQLSYSE